MISIISKNRVSGIFAKINAFLLKIQHLLHNETFCLQIKLFDKTGNAGAGWGYMTFYGEKKGRHFSASPLNQRAQWQPHSIALCII